MLRMQVALHSGFYDVSYRAGVMLGMHLPCVDSKEVSAAANDSHTPQL